jgi:hypothetical protein
LVCNGENVKKLDADTRWYFNGENLENQINNNSRLHSDKVYYDQKVKGKTRKVRMTLTINKTSVEDAGNYTCEVIINQNRYNKTIILTVQQKGKVIYTGHNCQCLKILYL